MRKKVSFAYNPYQQNDQNSVSKKQITKYLNTQNSRKNVGMASSQSSVEKGSELVGWWGGGMCLYLV